MVALLTGLELNVADFAMLCLRAASWVELFSIACMCIKDRTVCASLKSSVIGDLLTSTAESTIAVNV